MDNRATSSRSEAELLGRKRFLAIEKFIPEMK